MLKQKKDFLFGIVFGLHHFGSAQDRRRLSNAQAKKGFFVWHCVRLALSLPCCLRPIVV
jgi:hypothetical protein